jgi:hypothetical protein
MATIKIMGQAKVKSIKALFKKDIGVNIEIYDQEGNPAPDDVTLGSIRTKSPKSTEVKIVGQSKVKTVEKYFENNYGVKVDILNPDGSLADNEATLGDTKRLYEGNFMESETEDSAELEEAETETVEFDIYNALDLNLYYRDYPFSELQETNPHTIYEEFMEEFSEESESFIWNYEGLTSITLEDDNGNEFALDIHENIKLLTDDDQIRLICFYFYDDTEYAPCEVEAPSGKTLTPIANTEKIAPNIEYIESIALQGAYCEESDSDELYFELEDASPGDEEGALPRLVICTSKGVIDDFIVDQEESPEDRFEKAVKKALSQ